jgi:hypothetical protein
MTKIIVKKNTKPRKKATQKQKQTQKQNVTVNIGTNIIKKRGRPKKATQTKQQPTKQAQPIISPSFSSFNQPIFKPPIPQQSSLASTILATQERPKVVAEEKKEQSSLIKALQEQNSNDPIETKTNDLERVRNKRVEKLEKQEREALTSQVLSNQQDDTEEINLLSSPPKSRDIEYMTSSTQTPTRLLSSEAISHLPPITSRKELSILSSGRSTRLQSLLDDATRDKFYAQQQLLIGREKAEQSLSQEDEAETVAVDEVNPEVAAQQEEVLKQVQERGPTELVTETVSEPTPLTQPTVELGFGGLSEEPIQTSVGQFLPPEPVSQNELAVKETKKKGKTILKPIEPPPPITEPQETAPSILQEVRAADQYVTEQLVKDKGPPPSGIPIADAEVIDPSQRIPSETDQIEAKWNELKKAKIITSKRTVDGTRRPKEDLLSEIQFIDGYETWEPIKRPNRPGPKPKVVVAQAVIGGTEL